MGDVDAQRVRWIEQDRMHAHSPSTWIPLGTRRMAAQSLQLVPSLTAIGRLEEGRVFRPRVNRVGTGQRRLQMPDSLERPRVRRAVVPEVSPRLAVVEELVAHRIPRLAAIVRALNDLAKPVAALRRIDPVRIHRRRLHVEDFETAKVRSVNLPVLPRPIRRENEGSLFRADENANLGHGRGSGKRGYSVQKDWPCSWASGNRPSNLTNRQRLEQVRTHDFAQLCRVGQSRATSCRTHVIPRHRTHLKSAGCSLHRTPHRDQSSEPRFEWHSTRVTIFEEE